MIDYPADFDWDNPAAHWQRAKRLMKAAAEQDADGYRAQAAWLVAQATAHYTAAGLTDRLAGILNAGREQAKVQRTRQPERRGY